MTKRTIALNELKRRAGLEFTDGRLTRLAYDFHGRTVQEADEASEGPVHRAQKAAGEKYFIERGCRIFPFQIGVESIRAIADFAAARKNRVILVECLVDSRQDDAHTQLLMAALSPPPTLAKVMSPRLDHKLQIAEVAELWFVVEDIGRTILKQRSYVGSRLRKPRTADCELGTRFWLYRPAISASV